jgi:hypothetical protein
MTVEVAISGHQNPDGSVGAPGLTYSFSLVSTTPIVTPTGPLIDAAGNIDSTKFPSVPGYTQNIDITFRICGAVQGNDGNSYPVRWATATESSGTGPGASVGYGWFTASEAPGAPKITIAGMSFTQSDPHNIVLDDNLDDDNAYYYSLGFVVPDIAGAGSAYYITIDPKIVTPPPVQQ